MSTPKAFETGAEAFLSDDELRALDALRRAARTHKRSYGEIRREAKVILDRARKRKQKAEQDAG